MNFSEATLKLSSIKMRVDKMHILNHTGEFCLANCDPCKEKSLQTVNSVVCEQSFTYTNKYKNTKSMNYQHYNLYFLYIIDCHNLRNLKRLYEIKPNYIPNKPVHPSPVDLITSKMNAVTIESAKEQSEPSIEKNIEYQHECDICKKTYQNDRVLKIHHSKSHKKMLINYQRAQTWPALAHIVKKSSNQAADKSGICRVAQWHQIKTILVKHSNVILVNIHSVKNQT